MVGSLDSSMNSQMHGVDCIQIENIRVAGKHGVSAAERDACLPLEINILLEVDLRKAESSDTIEDTVNYSTIRKRVVELVESTSCKLLEKLAGVVLNDLFSDPRILQGRICISKPQRLDGATPSVTIVRVNNRQ
jgi:dihydroneopterin aldolase